MAPAVAMFLDGKSGEGIEADDNYFERMATPSEIG